MRTTIDMPDALFRRTKATAAVRGITLKELIVGAVERDLNQARLNQAKPPAKKRRVPKLPLVHLKSGRPLDLSNFDFDDLLS